MPIKDSADYAYGYDVMMAKYLAEQMGMELEIVRLDGIRSCRRCSPARWTASSRASRSRPSGSSRWTSRPPYYYASIVGLVKADGPYAEAAGISDLAGATCTSQQATRVV